MENDGSDNLKRLKERLYKTNKASFEGRLKRPRFDINQSRAKQIGINLKPKWKRSSVISQKKPFRYSKLLRRLLIFGGLFFTVAFLSAAYFWSQGSNFVSSKNIDLVFEGAKSVSAGKAGEWKLEITNNNTVSLELADLILEYPDRTRNSINKKEIARERRSLGTINAGETKDELIQVILFGREEAELFITATLEYRIAGSNAIFAKVVKYAIKLLEPVIEIAVNLPKEANAGEELLIEVEYLSNAESLIDGLILKMDYPAGFQFKNSIPEPINNNQNDSWRIGSLESGKKRSIKIIGILDGQDLDEKAFYAQIGVLDDEETINIYGEIAETVVLKKSLLGISIVINGRNQELNIANAGDTVRVDILWKNSLPIKIENGIIEAKIGGRAVDRQSISISRGFLRTTDQTLVWNAGSLPELRFIEPGAEGQVSFNFSIFSPLPQESALDTNFTISVKGTVRGEKAIGDFSGVDIKGSEEKEIDISSDLQFAVGVLHSTGPFINSGSIPPKVGSKTDYTVIWSLSNSTNNLDNVEIRSFLPSYMQWLNILEPANTQITYDETTGEIIWDVGPLSAGTGIFSPAKDVAFQIGLIPSLSQVGSSPILISEMVVEGKDRFTNVTLRKVKREITTRLDNDPGFVSGQDKVIQ